MQNVMILGHGRHGKDETAAILQSVTGKQYAGSSSVYLCPYVAKELGISEEEAFLNRHVNRQFWYALGKRLREADPGLLVKACLTGGPIVAGFRELCEIEFAVHSGSIQHVIWVERDYELDPTMDFTLSDVSRTIAQSAHCVTLDVLFNKSQNNQLFRFPLRGRVEEFAKRHQLV